MLRFFLDSIKRAAPGLPGGDLISGWLEDVHACKVQPVQAWLSRGRLKDLEHQARRKAKPINRPLY